MSANDTTELSPAAVPSPSVGRARRRDERGQGMVEYALILALIAVVVIVALQLVGNGSTSLYGNIQQGVHIATGN
jgi:pilus assembly protein Flp/PilA